MTISIALVGRPNVGKSTLYNRLTGTRHALVHDMPGVTRDWREGKGRIGDLKFRVLDTAGLEEATGDTLEAGMQRQTQAAIEQADIICFMVDAKAGLLPDDRIFAQHLRKASKPVLLLINKCENKRDAENLDDAWSLGLGEPVGISAEHGEGMADLFTAMLEAIQQHYPWEEEASAIEAEAGAGSKELQLAIVGRPNAGKSTLMNALLGEERVLTGPIAGITRDSIAVPWEFDDQKLTLIDTAGMRRRSNVDENLEQLSVRDARRAIQYAQVVILMVDATQPFEKQDLTIARHVIDEGRALILAVNKWDQVKDKDALLKQLQYGLEHDLAQVRGVPLVPVSALKKTGLKDLIKTALKTYELWNTRYGTSDLNRFLQEALEMHPPPLVKGKRIKLRYMTQVKARPPSFVLFGTRVDALPETYVRYLTTGLRDVFNLPGVPIRIILRQPKNPYAGKK